MTERDVTRPATPSPQPMNDLRTAIHDILTDPSYDVTQDQVDDILDAFRAAQAGPSFAVLNELRERFRLLGWMGAQGEVEDAIRRVSR